MTEDILDLIENGPPEGPLTRFLNVFGEKAKDTQKMIQQVLAELGWD